MLKQELDYGGTSPETGICTRSRSSQSGISPVKRKDKGLVTTAEAAVGGLYRSFCELGAND